VSDTRRGRPPWLLLVLLGCGAVVVVLATAVALAGRDAPGSGEGQWEDCGNAVTSLSELMAADADAGEIRDAAVSASARCEEADAPSYCRSTAAAAWRTADSSRSDEAKARALATFRRTEPRCLEALDRREQAQRVVAGDRR
jgi:hypothetical protein